MSIFNNQKPLFIDEKQTTIPYFYR